VLSKGPDREMHQRSPWNPAEIRTSVLEEIYS